MSAIIAHCLGRPLVPRLLILVALLAVLIWLLAAFPSLLHLPALDRQTISADSSSGPVVSVSNSLPATPASNPAVASTPIGSGATASAQVIARWDMVPLQTCTDTFSVGIVAFHINGIARVEFSANGRPPINGPMTLNKATQVWEYTASFRAADFADGPVNLRATAYPRTEGRPRALEPLSLNANAHKSLEATVVYADARLGDDHTGTGTHDRPVQTLRGACAAILHASKARFAGDNATIILSPGDYPWAVGRRQDTPATQRGWLTIRPAAGVSPDAVNLISPPPKDKDLIPGLSVSHIHLAGLTVRTPLETYPHTHAALWLDAVHIAGAGLQDPNDYLSPVSWPDGIYVTNSLATNVIEGFTGCNLVRNSLIDLVYDDAFSDSMLVINSECKQQLGAAEYHSDIWQQRTDNLENVILYGLRATDRCRVQGIFSRATGISNMAIVNCCFDEQGYPAQNQWVTRSDHLVMQYNTFLGTPLSLFMHDSKYANIGFAGSRNCLIAHNVFQWFNTDATSPALEDGVRIESNHFINQLPAYMGPRDRTPPMQTFGSHATTGAAIPTGVGAYKDAAPPTIGRNTSD